MVPDWVPQLIWLVAALVGGGLLFYYLPKGQWLGVIWSSFGTLVLVLLGVTLYLHNGVIARRSRTDSVVFTGKLVPGNDAVLPMPPTAFALMLGDDLRVLTRSSEQRIFMLNNEPFLTLRVADGQLYITTTVLDSRGEFIVRVINNEFQASSERAFNPKQPDEHTLVVRDTKGVEVLNVRYLNPRAIRLVGRFQLPGQKNPVQILPVEGLIFPNGSSIRNLTLDMTQAPDAGVIGF